MYKKINMSNIILILLFMHTCLNIVANDFVWNTSDACLMGMKETQKLVLQPWTKPKCDF